MGDPWIGDRKIEHIDIVINKDVEYGDYCNIFYDSILLIHQAFPKISYGDVETTIEFLGYELNAPLIITGMTGGHPDVTSINEKLAKLASKHRIAIGVGSQRSLLINKSEKVSESYRVVRRNAKDIPVIGNIGLNTLNDLSFNDIEYIVDVIEADALAIHLNPGQELIQPEGDTRFNADLLNKVEEILDRLDIPVIIKEVGTGLSMEVVKTFYEIGIRYFDVAGACGTNWIVVEGLRLRTSELKRELAFLLRNWGIPTPLSVIETRYVAPEAYIIASGGVWNGVKGIKNLVLGADMIGFAKPVIEKLVKEGFEAADQYIHGYIETLKSMMFLIGARNIYELRKKPVVLLEPIISYLDQRGVDLRLYVNEVRVGRL